MQSEYFLIQYMITTATIIKNIINGSTSKTTDKKFNFIIPPCNFLQGMVQYICATPCWRRTLENLWTDGAFFLLCFVTFFLIIYLPMYKLCCFINKFIYKILLTLACNFWCFANCSMTITMCYCSFLNFK